MRLEWVKSSLDWIIRLQGAYTILATILAGSLGTGLRALLRYYTNIPVLWSTPIWLSFAGLVLIALFAWGGHLGTFVNYPDFELSIYAIVWIYNRAEDKTIFYLGSRLLNRGAPSIAESWSAEYIVGQSRETMKGFYLNGPSVLTIGNERLTIENNELLNVKTAEVAVERGGAVYGRLVFALPGDRVAQVKSVQFKIEVRTQDYTKRQYSAYYVPSAEPMTGLLRHPFEKGEFINAGSPVEIAEDAREE